MDWLRANYDRAALLAAAFFLFLCALFIFLSASVSAKNQRPSKCAARRTTKSRRQSAGSVEAIEIAGALQDSSGSSGLLARKKHFIGAAGRGGELAKTSSPP